MGNFLAIYGSPRKKGNTSVLLDHAVQGALESGAQVEKIVLCELNLSPCLEIYGCKETGRCVIEDDFQKIHDQLLACEGLMLASPIFFYTVSGHTKILMDRCQSLWVKKYWIDRVSHGDQEKRKKGLFISAGATQGKKLFDGTLLSIKYFFDVLDMELWKACLFRGLDAEGDVLKHPDYLQEAYAAGKEFASILSSKTGPS